MRPAWLAALALGCSSPSHAPVAVHAPASFAFERVGYRTLGDHDAVYGLGDRSIIALSRATGAKQWEQPVHATSIAAAGSYIGAVGGDDWRHQTLTLLATDGHVVASCPFSVPDRAQANAVESTIFASDGIPYVLWVTWRDTRPRGDKPSDEEERAEQRASKVAHTCGLVRFDLEPACRAVPDELTRFGLERCQSSDDPAAYLAPIEPLFPPIVRNGSIDEQERELVETDADAHQDLFHIVTLVAKTERWHYELSRVLVEKPPK